MNYKTHYCVIMNGDELIGIYHSDKVYRDAQVQELKSICAKRKGLDSASLNSHLGVKYLSVPNQLEPEAGLVEADAYITLKIKTPVFYDLSELACFSDCQIIDEVTQNIHDFDTTDVERWIDGCTDIDIDVDITKITRKSELHS